MLPRQTAAVSAESTALTVMLSMCCMRHVVFRCREGQKCVCGQCSKTLGTRSPWGQLPADIRLVDEGPFAVLNRRRAIAGCATAKRKLLGMLPCVGYQGFRIAPIPSGGKMGERWGLWWNGRELANVTPARGGGYRLHLNALKMWQTKSAPVVSIRQGKRFAERWCAARLYPGLRLREAVNRLTDNTPGAPAAPLPGLPPYPRTAATGPAVGRGSCGCIRQGDSGCSRSGGRRRSSPGRRGHGRETPIQDGRILKDVTIPLVIAGATLVVAKAGVPQGHDEIDDARAVARPLLRGGQPPVHAGAAAVAARGQAARPQGRRRLVHRRTRMAGEWRRSCPDCLE